MYMCRECGRVFEAPETVKESRGGGTYGTYYEEFGVCPHCASDDIAEAYQCEGCGEWFEEDEIQDFYCYKCLKEALEDTDAVWKFMHDEFIVDDWSDFLHDIHERRKQC